MIKAAIYARYSTDLQRKESIEDQIESCTRYCESQNFKVVATYSDAETSGASIIGRDGFEQLSLDAEAGKFEVVIAESVDRFARRLADVATLSDDLNFLGIRLHTISNGELTPLLIGIMGGIAQDYLTQTRQKTIRGLRGKVLSGLSASGIAYGYKPVPEKKGERTIDPFEAKTVIRIFEMYANGTAPRSIAKLLNKEGVPGPKGREWGDTTIRGQVARGTGLLNNALYDGRIEWNRCSYIKNPRTGKRVARPNPKEEWEIVDVPELRIVNPELWNSVKLRQRAVTTRMKRDDKGNALNRAHRRKHLLSGVIKCGECGSPFVMVGANRYGCNNARSKGVCQNTFHIPRSMIEKEVINALRHKMFSPEVAASSIKQWETLLSEVNQGKGAEQDAYKARLKEIGNRQSHILSAIENGMYNEQIKERSQKLEEERIQIQELLEEGEAPPPPVPSQEILEKTYYSIMDNLLVFTDQGQSPNSTLSDTIRHMIKEITVTPNKERDGLDVTLEGSFAGIVEGWQDAEQEKAASDETASTSVVAGARFELTTFRL